MRMALRVCRDCGKEAYDDETLKEFVRVPRLPHGRDNWCKKCFGKYYDTPEYKARYKERKRGYRLKLIEYLGGKCSMCGNDDVRVLHAHAPNGHSVHYNGFSYRNAFFNWKDRDNLVLLCANCHMITHYADTVT